MLPIRIKPKDNELASSWLRRLANQNGTDLNTLSNLIFNNSKLIINDIDKYLNEEEIHKISSYTTVEESQIYQLTLHSLLSKINTSTLVLNSKWNWCIPSGGVYKHKTNGLQFCPICLKEQQDSFYIFSRLSWNISCLKHKCLLHTNCPSCNYKYSPHLIKFQDSIAQCTNCSFDLSTIEEQLVSNSIVNLQLFLNDTITNNFIVQNPYLFLDNNVKELFYSMRIFTSFIYRIKKNITISKKLEKYISFNKEYDENAKLNNSFDSMSCLSRLKIISDVEIISQFNIEKLIHIFIHSKITYKQFLGDNEVIPLSSTSKKISAMLTIRTNTNNSNRNTKNIEPKSIKDVDKLMGEIELFL